MSFHLLIFGTLLLLFLASQVFWLRRLAELGRKWIPSVRRRKGLGGAGVILFLFLFAYNLVWAHRSPSPVRLTLGAALLEAPFLWWVLSSLAGFIVVIPFWLADRVPRLARSDQRIGRPVSNPSQDPKASEAVSAGRRSLLYKAALFAGAAPFVADAYGLVFGRSELKITHEIVRLTRLPKAFDGFRIAQLSDLHIGPFMTARTIRKIADLTNTLKADLIVLTGDFVTWDPSTQGAVVEALAGLRAPFGVFGCLGNHELWTHTQDSITRLFAQKNIKILRKERAAIRSNGEAINLMGVDFEAHRTFGHHGEGYVRQYLDGVEPLLRPDIVNILLSHNPNTFDRAAELGIDLSLAGHTHGGQVTLEFVDKNLSPARLITPYVRGWFRRPGGQLYVNCGIGTIFAPIRFDAPPEITVFELVRA